MATESPQPADAQEQEMNFLIQKIYTKDLSFESPEAPTVFQAEWKPELNLNLQTNSTLLEQDVYEVEVKVTVTVKSSEKTAFLVEVNQAGIFSLKDFNKEQLGPILGSICPSIIFPYLREVVSDVVVKGGFPQLCLAPINFEAIYSQQMQQQNQQAGNGAVTQGANGNAGNA